MGKKSSDVVDYFMDGDGYIRYDDFFMIFVDRVDLGKCQTVTTAHQLPAWRDGLQNLTAPVQSRRTE